MTAQRPALVAIDPDGEDANRIGRLPDGRQFFLTNPFHPGTIEGGRRHFAAQYLFDPAGGLLDARIEEVGLNDDGPIDEELLDQWLAALGESSHERIEVQPFEVSRLGHRFGLIASYQDDGDYWTVEVQPGNYMAFFQPWDSGSYDT